MNSNRRRQPFDASDRASARPSRPAAAANARAQLAEIFCGVMILLGVFGMLVSAWIDTAIVFQLLLVSTLLVGLGFAVLIRRFLKE
jgi:hypothetical protein